MTTNTAKYMGTVTQEASDTVVAYTLGLIMPTEVNVEFARALLLICMYEDERNAFYSSDEYEPENAGEYMEKVHNDLLSDNCGFIMKSPDIEITLDEVFLLTQAECDALRLIKPKTNIFEFDGLNAANNMLNLYQNLKNDGTDITQVNGSQNNGLKVVLKEISKLAENGCKEITVREIEAINNIF